MAGKREILETLEFSGDEERDKRTKIRHPGTFNANPVSAAAGVACLEIVSTGSPQESAANRAGEIRRAMNEVIKAHSVSGCVYGDSSVFHIILGATPQNYTGNDIRNPFIPPEILKMGGDKNLTRLLQLSMLVEGVDLFHLGGLVSSAHTNEDVEKTIKAFEVAISRLKKEGVLK